MRIQDTLLILQVESTLEWEAGGRINEAGSRRQLQEARGRRKDNQVRDSQSTKKEAAPLRDSKHEHHARGDRTVWKDQETGA